MTDVIAEYQKWKQQGENLRAQARHAMETRYRELLLEAARIAEEYRRDFGAPPKPPAPVTTFRYKGTAKAKAKPKPKPQEPEPPKAPQKPDPKMARLRKKLENTRKKLDDAKAAGAPTRALEDRVYEIEDEIKLAAQAG